MTEASTDRFGALATTLAGLDPRASIEPASVRPGSTDRHVIAALAPLSVPPAPGAGTRLSLGRTIGQGGMGVVRVATQLALGREVAVKTVRSDRRSETATLKLLREAWVTGRLEHPDVVPVYDIGVDPEAGPAIVLKRIDGVAWSELVHDAARVREQFGAERLLDWNLALAMRVCNAVHFAHSRGILHRDLKPDNVMVGAFGEVYVLDWGIAVSLREDSEGRLPLASDVREIAGTLCYMAPEMLDQNGARLSPRTDVYLLGAVLYEIVMGKPPHGGTTMLEVLHEVALSEPAFDESAPEELVAICKRAMARAPEDRFATAEELRLAISAFLEHRGSADLARRARERMAELEQILAAPLGPDGEGARRLALYDTFGQCRFGLREALRAWPDNVDARDDLQKAVTAMIEYELGHHDARAAAVLLAELAQPPAQLVARVSAAEKAREAERVRVDGLERRERDLDPRTGARTRVLFGMLFGLVTAALAINAAQISDRERIGDVIFPLAILALVAVFAVLTRKSIWATAFNRRLFTTVAVMLVSQAALSAGAIVADVPSATIESLGLFVWATTFGVVAVHVDRRIGFAAGLCALGGVLGLAFPAIHFYVIAACSFFLFFSIGGIWRPMQAPPSSGGPP